MLDFAPSVKPAIVPGLDYLPILEHLWGSAVDVDGTPIDGQFALTFINPNEQKIDKDGIPLFKKNGEPVLGWTKCRKVKNSADFSHVQDAFLAICATIEPGYNPYIAPALVSADVERWRRGKKPEIVGTLAIVIDDLALDAIKSLPVPPHAIAETSPGNFQAYYFLDRGYAYEAAEPVQRYLVWCTGGDAHCKDASHVFRIVGQGCWNYPSASKRAKGRAEKELTRLVEASGAAITLEDLRNAFFARYGEMPALDCNGASSGAGLKCPEGVDLDCLQDRERVRAFLQKLVDEGDIAVEDGTGRNRTMTLVQWCLDYVSPDVACALMLEAWAPACDPPWEEDELRPFIHSLAQSRQNEVGCRASRSIEAMFPVAPATQPKEANSPTWPGDDRSSRWPMMPAGVLPKVIADFANVTAARTCLPPAVAAIACISALAGCLSHKYRICPRRNDPDWQVPATFWAMIICKTGSRKTELIRAATAPIEKLENERRAAFDTRHDACKREAAEWDTNYGSGRQKANGTTSTGHPPRPEEPTHFPIVFHDMTVQALVPFASSHGFFLNPGELSGLVNSIGQFTNGRGNDKEAYLRMFDAQPYSVARVGAKGTPLAEKITRIPSWSGNILGALPPHVFASTKAFHDGSGFVDRFIPVRVCKARPIDDEAAVYDGQPGKVYANLIHLLIQKRPCDAAPTHILTATAEAHAYWRKLEELKYKVTENNNTPEKVRGFYSKIPTAFATLSLLFQAIEDLSRHQMIGAEVSGENARRAFEVVTKYILPMCWFVHGGAMSDENNALKWVMGYILSRPDMVEISRRDIKQTCPQIRHAAGDNQAKDQAVNMVTNLLIENGWLAQPQTSTGGRGSQTMTWAINPEVHKLKASDNDELALEHDPIIPADDPVSDFACPDVGPPPVQPAAPDDVVPF